MGKNATARKRAVDCVDIDGRKLVIMSEEEYERLLDEIDAADAERIANDPNDPVLTWDDIKHELTRSRIAGARKERRVTQKELAKRLKVKQSTVSRMEKPDANLTLATLGRVAKALKCPVHELLT